MTPFIAHSKHHGSRILYIQHTFLKEGINLPNLFVIELAMTLTKVRLAGTATDTDRSSLRGLKSYSGSAEHPHTFMLRQHLVTP